MSLSIMIGVVGLLVITMIDHLPSWPLPFDSSEWCCAWLLMTVVEAYGAFACFCGIVVASERPCCAMLWVVGIIVGGTPTCCAYCAVRLLSHGTLCLQPRPLQRSARPPWGL